MIVNRPSIMIYADHPDKDLLKEICAGIEEEGVLFQIVSGNGDVDELAHQAAAESMLGSGIGITGQQAAMQMSPLPKGHNVFELIQPTLRQCRDLGANSARAVKKMPFRSLAGGSQ